MNGVIFAGAVVLAGFVVTFSGVGTRGRLVGLTIMALGALLGLTLGWPSGATPWWTTLVAGITLVGMLAVASYVALRAGRNRRGEARLGRGERGDSLDDERP